MAQNFNNPMLCFWVEIKKSCNWNCCPWPSKGHVPQIESHLNSCQCPLINYLYLQVWLWFGTTLQPKRVHLPKIKKYKSTVIPHIVSAAKIQFIRLKIEICCNYLNFLHFPYSKKGSAETISGNMVYLFFYIRKI